MFSKLTMSYILAVIPFKRTLMQPLKNKVSPMEKRKAMPRLKVRSMVSIRMVF